jgi:hypothetical protein
MGQRLPLRNGVPEAARIARLAPGAWRSDRQQMHREQRTKSRCCGDVVATCQRQLREVQLMGELDAIEMSQGGTPEIRGIIRGDSQQFILA